MKALILIVVLGGIAAGAGWLYAGYDLNSHVTHLGERLTGMPSPRSGAPPSEADLGAKVASFAVEEGLEAEDIEVKVEAITSANRDRADVITRQVTTKLDEAQGNRPDIAGLPAPRMEIRSTLVEIKARVKGKKWLWSIDQAFSVHFTLHGG